MVTSSSMGDGAEGRWWANFIPMNTREINEHGLLYLVSPCCLLCRGSDSELVWRLFSVGLTGLLYQRAVMCPIVPDIKRVVRKSAQARFFFKRGRKRQLHEGHDPPNIASRSSQSIPRHDDILVEGTDIFVRRW
jgi:hypothetical protein